MRCTSQLLLTLALLGGLWSVPTSAGEFNPLTFLEQEIEISPAEFQLGNDLYKFGNLIELTATASDTFIFGKSLQVTETIGGDLFSFTRELKLENPIADDLRAFGAEIQINAQIAGEALLLAHQIEFGPQAEIQGAALLRARKVKLAGHFQNDVTIYASEIEVDPQTTIAGRLKYFAPQAVSLPRENIREGIEFQQIFAAADKPKLNWLRGLMTLIAGTLVLALLGRSANTLIKPIRKKFWRILFLGLALLFTPLLIILLLITQIGLLLGGILALIWLLFLLLAYALAGFALGALLWPLPARPDLITKFNRLGVGTLIIVLLDLLPYAEILQLFIILITLGLLAYLEFNFLKKFQENP